MRFEIRLSRPATDFDFKGDGPVSVRKTLVKAMESSRACRNRAASAVDMVSPDLSDLGRSTWSTGPCANVRDLRDRVEHMNTRINSAGSKMP